MRHHRTLARAASLALSVPFLIAWALLAPPPASANDASDAELRALAEEVHVAAARLQFAVDRSTRLGFPLGGDDRREQKDLVRRVRFLLHRAATVSPRDAESMEQVIDQMAAARDEVDEFTGRAVPAWAGDRPRRNVTYKSAYAEVQRFRDLVEDLRWSRPRLSPAEVDRVDSLLAEGWAEVGVVQELRNVDHVTRDRHVRKLMRVSAALEAHVDTARSWRTPGHQFIPLRRSRQLWTELSYEENGYAALRTRFIEPASAHVTVRNDLVEHRPLFIEVTFLDAAGDVTGSATWETPYLDEMRPGEIREVLVPITTDIPRFWDVTRRYLIHLD